MLRRQPDDVESVPSKRNKLDGTMVISASETAMVLSERQERKSGLAAPLMQLTGHEGAVYSICFDSTGKNLCSASMDTRLYLWDVYGNCANYNVLSGHKSAVLETKWFPNSANIISCSADKTVGVWDANKGIRTRKLTDHAGVVNSCCIAQASSCIFASGSDDCSSIVWDVRSRQYSHMFHHDYQVTAVALSNDGSYLYTGGIDNIIRCWDMRAAGGECSAPALQLHGHTDTITGLAVSPDGHHLLSNAMDSSVNSWDVRPYVVSEAARWEKTFSGVHHGAEKNLLRCSWSRDQEMVSCGSADRMVHIWDSMTSKTLHYLAGHKGSVNEVIFHPTEPIVASCGSDKTIYLGELGPAAK